MQTIISSLKGDWKDGAFILGINILPFLYSTGLLPRYINILGPGVLSIIALTPLLFTIKSFPRTTKPYYVTTIILLIYVIYKFITSCINIGFTESFTNFRYNFIGVIPFFIALVYLLNLCHYKILKIIKLLMIATCIEAILFIAHAVGILDIYTGLVMSMSESRFSVTRIYMGYPPMMISMFATFAMLYILTHKNTFLYGTVILLSTVFLSYTRSNMGEIIIVSFLIICLSIIKSLLRATFFTKFILIGIAFTIAAYFVFPTSFSFWQRRITTTKNEVKYDQGTYSFREKLIENAFYMITTEKHEWDGMGYERDSRKGEYSFVQGGDTSIPPILYCEGIIGMILRISVVASVIFVGLKFFLVEKNKVGKAIGIIFIAMITSQVVNYMQTIIFVKFFNILFPLILIIRIYETRYERNTLSDKIRHDSYSSQS